MSNITINGVANGGNTYIGSDYTAKQRAAEGRDTLAEGIANPDNIVGKLGGGSSYYFQSPNGATSNTYFRSAGVEGWSSIQAEGANSKLAYVIFSNTESLSSEYCIREYGGPNNQKNVAKRAHVVANMAEGVTQTFKNYGSLQMFTSGGMTMMSGTLRFNFNQDASMYNYFSDSSKKIAVVCTTKNDGSDVLTTFSHGDLNMQGGTIASLTADESYSRSTYGAFRFTSINYTDGVIALRLNGLGKVDSIDLTGYYEKSVDNTSGSAVTSYAWFEGGTVTKTGGKKVTFDFGKNLDWLIDSQENGGKGVKVIAWDSANKTALLESDFAGNSFGENSAIFTVADDGLYVKYGVVVPEPATLAAMFGAVALIFAAYRRRK